MPTLVFVAIAAAMTALVLGWVLRPLLARRVTGAGRAPSAARRWIRNRSTRRVGVAVAIALPLLAVALYMRLGESGALAAESELDAQAAYGTLPATAMREEIVVHLARNPRDARGLILLARLDFAHDRFTDAADAYRRALAASPKVDNDPAIWCEYADALGMAQGGTLAGQPREFVLHALALKPGFPRALEMAGSAAFDAGDYAGAARYWRDLVRQLPDEAPARRDLLAAVARADLLTASGRP